MHRLFKKSQIFTIPNILSFFRMLLIPVIIWMYCFENDYTAATAVILLSGATDIADGIIARKFNMVSDFGKFLDPLADKMTQMTLIICLAFKYPLMIYLVILFVLKECIMGTLAAITLKKHDSVNSAKWHGKLNTIILYSAMVIMIIFPHLPEEAINSMFGLCIVSMCCSLILYTKFHIDIWKAKK